MGFIEEFKQFAIKGNAMDMAVGIILGAAFNKVVSSIVQDIIMPPIGMMLGQVDFKNLQIVLQSAGVDATGTVIPAVGIRYGAFLNTVVEFLIIALSVFVIVKFMNRLILRRESSHT